MNSSTLARMNGFFIVWWCYQTFNDDYQSPNVNMPLLSPLCLQGVTPLSSLIVGAQSVYSSLSLLPLLWMVLCRTQAAGWLFQHYHLLCFLQLILCWFFSLCCRPESFSFPLESVSFSTHHSPSAARLESLLWHVMLFLQVSLILFYLWMFPEDSWEKCSVISSLFCVWCFLFLLSDGVTCVAHLQCSSSQRLNSCKLFPFLWCRWYEKAGWPSVTLVSWRAEPKSTGSSWLQRLCPGIKTMRWAVHTHTMF